MGSSKTLHQVSPKWSFILGLNTLLGIVLWFGLSTDFAWNYNYANLLFPVFVGIVAIVSYRLLRVSDLSEKNKAIGVHLLISSIIGSALHLIILIASIILIPIAFIFPTPFVLLYGELSDSYSGVEYSVKSPDGTKLAQLWMDSATSYTSYSLQLSYSFAPFITRQNLYKFSSNDRNLISVSWMDDDTVIVFDGNNNPHSLRIGLIKFKSPGIRATLLAFYISYSIIKYGIQVRPRTQNGIN